jgi:hypothetical protein
MDARLTTIDERCVPLGPDCERRQPLAVDLYCGGGGVGMGLFLAGFDVIGYDINEQAEYPFEFVRKSALEAELAEAEFVWASPPCQSFTAIIPTAKRELYGHRWNYENLIPSTREKLVASGKPYVIENVMGAVHELSGPLAMLCGTMFPKLKVFRHRLFESNFGLEVKDRRCSHAGRSLGDRSPNLGRKTSTEPLDPLNPDVSTLQLTMGTGEDEWKSRTVVRKTGESAGTTDTYYYSPSGVRYRSIGEIERDLRQRVEIWEADRPARTSGPRPRTRGGDFPTDLAGQMFPVYGDPGRRRGTVAEWANAMQIDWLTKGKSIAQAIPPPYSEYIGRQALLKLVYTLDYKPISY